MQKAAATNSFPASINDGKIFLLKIKNFFKVFGVEDLRALSSSLLANTLKILFPPFLWRRSKSKHNKKIAEKNSIKFLLEEPRGRQGHSKGGNGKAHDFMMTARRRGHQSKRKIIMTLIRV